MNRDELIEALAALLAGLQVPLSLNGPLMLGAGCEPYRKILHDAGFGWKDDEVFETYIRETLEREFNDADLEAMADEHSGSHLSNEDNNDIG